MKSKSKIFFKIIGILLILVFLFVIGFTIFINAKISKYRKSIALDKDKITQAYSRPEIFDNAGNEVKFSKSQSIIKIDKIPEHTKNAFIAIEDKNFYKHNGFNYKRMGKALLSNVKNRKYKEGASTISQQLVKNTLLSNEKTIDRKLKEYALTGKLEKQFSKDEILEIYLNTIYFGNNNYGIENASQNYFGKSASELSLNESAILAGVIKSPTYFTKEENNQALVKRKNLVLSEMLADKKISKEVFDENSALGAEIKTKNNFGCFAPYQIATVDEAAQILNVSEDYIYKNKLKIYTYFDENLQQGIEKILNENSENLKCEKGSVLLDNETLGVVAINSSVPNFTKTKRQAGSILKPIVVYAPAIEENKILPETPILDEATSFDGYQPKNANGKFNGYVSATKALEKSLNIPAVKTLEYVGIDKAKAIASKMGVSFEKSDTNLSLALGSCENGNTLISLCSAYATIANGGTNEKPHFIRKIVNANGKTIYENSRAKHKAIRDDTAYLTRKMLTNVSQNGTAKLLKSDFDIASKTGTVGAGNSGQNSDVYNVSSTTKHTLGVWFGSKNNENKNLLPSNITGSNLPTQCVKDVFEKLYKNQKPQNFSRPSTVLDVEIDSIELEENHRLILASDLAPERFKKTIEASVFNLPTEKSQNFEKPSAPNFKVSYDKSTNCVNITFDAKSFETYEILKNGKVLQKIENKKGETIIKDSLIQSGNIYAYQILSKQTNKNGQTILGTPSEKKEIFVQKQTEKISAFDLKSITKKFEGIFTRSKKQS